MQDVTRFHNIVITVDTQDLARKLLQDTTKLCIDLHRAACTIM